MLRLSNRQRPLVIAGLVTIALIVYYLASPLFIEVRVNETIEQSSSTELKTLAIGKFIDADSFHRTSGNAAILKLANGSLILRLDDFRTINGPDLFVYLSSDRQASNFVNLGVLTGNIGNQNYMILGDEGATAYRYVLIWCRAFKTLFGSAELVKPPT